MIGQQYNILNKKYINFKPQKVEWFEYTELDAKNLRRDIKKLDFYIYKPAEKVFWDFVSSRYLYCERKMDTQFNEFNINISQDIDKRNTEFKLVGNDPYISYDINFDADKSKYVYFKYSTSCLSENAQLFFTTYAYSDLSEEQSKVFTISPNDKLFEYILDMSDNSKWNGVSRQLRFDPVSYDNISKEGDCVLEYIEMSDRLPIYGSEKDFVKTQGVNGWSYYTYNNGITYREMVWNEQKSLWTAPNDEEIMISQTVQTSKNHMGTVRRWTCQADGKYAIKYSFIQRIDRGNSDKERLSHFVFRRNHKIIEKYIYDRENQSLAGSYETEVTLETGETLNFEFYNGSEFTTEVADIGIIIEKAE